MKSLIEKPITNPNFREIRLIDYKVVDVRYLKGDAFVIRMERNGLNFKAGQHVQLNNINNFNFREYSIYSGENDPYLEVLVKEIKDGILTPRLKKLKPNDSVELNGPFGRFTLNSTEISSNNYVFIASGTGIAPFHSFIRTYPELDYTLLHGVRYTHEAFEKEDYSKGNYILCASRDRKGDFHGRVTKYIDQHSFSKNTQFYICGNSNMIFDAVKILKNKGFTRENIHAEVYF